MATPLRLSLHAALAEGADGIQCAPFFAAGGGRSPCHTRATTGAVSSNLARRREEPAIDWKRRRIECLDEKDSNVA
jgi:hypothetical protein